MHASNTAAWRPKVREASDGIEAVKKELGTGRLHPETIIFAEGQGSALILPTYLPVSWSARSRRSSVRFHGGLFESALTDSNRRPLLTIEQRGGNGAHGREAAGTEV